MKEEKRREEKKCGQNDKISGTHLRFLWLCAEKGLCFDATILYERGVTQLAVKKGFTAIFWWQKEWVIKNATHNALIIEYKWDMNWPIGRRGHTHAATERLKDPHTYYSLYGKMMSVLKCSFDTLEVWLVCFCFSLIWMIIYEPFLMKSQSFHVLKWLSVFWKLYISGWTKVSTHTHTHTHTHMHDYCILSACKNQFLILFEKNEAQWAM